MRPMKKAQKKDGLVQKWVDDEARRLTADYETLYEERTRELAEVRAEMETFAYCISHDLRAPLVHVGGFVDLLLNHPGSKLDPKGQHYLHMIASSTFRLGRMIDDLLALTRVSQAELHLVSLDLETVVREVVEELQPAVEGRQVAWSVGAMPVVEADPTLLRDVLAQLLSNAIKFTRPREEARIDLQARRADGEIIVSVRDNGVGFDMKHADKLFGVFQRLHSAADFEGGGVGLVRVRRIIQRHGGRTWAEGVPGAGATFHFSLPIDDPLVA
jgi:light-regulated signal transduction histidine kinase (bacteriophytochrome)